MSVVPRGPAIQSHQMNTCCPRRTRNGSPGHQEKLGHFPRIGLSIVSLPAVGAALFTKAKAANAAAQSSTSLALGSCCAKRPSR